MDAKLRDNVPERGKVRMLGKALTLSIFKFWDTMHAPTGKSDKPSHTTAGSTGRVCNIGNGWDRLGLIFWGPSINDVRHFSPFLDSHLVRNHKASLPSHSKNYKRLNWSPPFFFNYRRTKQYVFFQKNNTISRPKFVLMKLKFWSKFIGNIYDTISLRN